MKTLVRDEKGQFVAPVKVSEVHILHDVWKIKILRNGQEHPSSGNQVQVKMKIECIAQPVKFNKHVFGLCLKNFWDTNTDDVEIFTAEKWADAFDAAKNRAYSELAKYDALVKEREQALINADL
jgi:hypothetical protein